MRASYFGFFRRYLTTLGEWSTKGLSRKKRQDEGTQGLKAQKFWKLCGTTESRALTRIAVGEEPVSGAKRWLRGEHEFLLSSRDSKGRSGAAFFLFLPYIFRIPDPENKHAKYLRVVSRVSGEL